MVLTGFCDSGNPSGVPEETLKQWVAKGWVEWLGFQKDMPTVLNEFDIVCLPTSYGEGVPQALIEAAAAGKPIVTTDMPGCREIVKDGINGLLVPPKNSIALADAIQKLAEVPIASGADGTEGTKDGGGSVFEGNRDL